MWQKNFAGTLSGDNQIPLGLALDTGGNVAIAGSFTGHADFGSGSVATGAGVTQAFLTTFTTAGAFRWQKILGTAFDQYGEAVAVDTAGNVVITGRFPTSSAFDCGGGAMTSFGSYDVYICKFTSTGAFVWQKHVGGTNWDEGKAIGVDTAGNVIVGGIFAGTADFGGGPISSFGSFDGFLAKYAAADGSFIWQKQLGGTSGDFVTGLGVDASGNTTAVGYFAGTANFGTGNLTSMGSNDVFVARYNGAGTPLFSQRYGGTGDERAFGNAVDMSGNVVLTGYFSSTISFGSGVLTNTNGPDIFLAKLNSAGVQQWQKQFQPTFVVSSQAEIGQAVGLNPTNGDVVLTGGIVGDVDFGGGPLPFASTGRDVFIAKFSSAGTYKWAKRFLGKFDDQGNAIKADASGNVYAAGQYGTDAAYSGFGGGTMNGPGANNGFAVKLGP